MKVSILGDSLSTFYSCILPDYALFYDINKAMENGLASMEDTWWYQVIQMLGGELLVNGAFSGSRASGTSFPAGNSYQRIRALKTDVEPDCILVHLGCNDYGYAVPIGKPESDLNYFYPAYMTMVRRLQEVYPHAKIICSTLMQTYITFNPRWHLPQKNAIGTPLEEYQNVIRKACQEYGVILADLAETGIIYDTLDGCHCTNKGHREMAQAWKKALHL